MSPASSMRNLVALTNTRKHYFISEGMSSVRKFGVEYLSKTAAIVCDPIHENTLKK